MEAAAVKSLERAIRILECFRDRQTPLSARRVADILDLPASSAFVLLRSLAQIGYLTFDPSTRDYFPTLMVTELGSWLPTSAHGLDEPRLLIEDIRDATGETVTLSAQNNMAISILSVAIGTQMIVLNARAGDRLPLLSSNVGHVALAARPDAEIAALVSRWNDQASSAEKAELPVLMKEIETIRKDGHGVGYGSVDPDLGTIAWPIASSHPANTLVVAVAGPSVRIRESEAAIVKKVKAIIRKHMKKS